MQKKKSKAWIWITISVVVVFIILLGTIAIVLMGRMGRALKNGTDTGAKAVREELEGMLSAVEEGDFAAFESYYADDVVNGSDMEEGFVKLREFVGEGAVIEKGQAITTEFASGTGGWNGDMTMLWELNSSNGEFTVEIRRIFDDESPADGVIYLEISSEYESVFLG